MFSHRLTFVIGNVTYKYCSAGFHVTQPWWWIMGARAAVLEVYRLWQRFLQSSTPSSLDFCLSTVSLTIFALIGNGSAIIVSGIPVRCRFWRPTPPSKDEKAWRVGRQVPNPVVVQISAMFGYGSLLTPTAYSAVFF